MNHKILDFLQKCGGYVVFEFSQGDEIKRLNLVMGKSGLCFGYSVAFIYCNILGGVEPEKKKFSDYVADRGTGLDLVLDLCVKSEGGRSILLENVIPGMLSDVGLTRVRSHRLGLFSTVMSKISAPGFYIAGWDGDFFGSGHVIAINGFRQQTEVFDPNYGCFRFAGPESATKFILGLIKHKYQNSKNPSCDQYLPSAHVG